MNKISRNFHPIKSGIVILALLSFLASSNLFADGATRLATQAEKDFNKSVLDVITKALPPAPEGWDRTNDSTEVTELQRVSPGSENFPFRVDYYISWQDTKRMLEARAKLDAELEKLAKGPAENMTEKNINELSKKTAAHDVKIRITLDVNQFGLGLDEKTKPAASIAGGLVFRSEGEDSPNTGWHEGATYIFLGKGWKVKRDGVTSVDTTTVKGVPSLTVQAIVVRVEADPERAKQIISKIDWEALKKLIKN